MRSPAQLKLAEAIRSELGEFAERWVRFASANELLPESDDNLDELVNRSRLGFEVLANLLEGADYTGYENVIRRFFQDWINRAGAYSGLLDIERVFPVFIAGQLDLDPDSDEGRAALEAIDDFFHSDLRALLLSDYLFTYEDIIGRESHHTAYVLAHFDAILSLTVHLNAVDSREDILNGMAPCLRDLLENVIGVGIWTETANGLVCRSLDILDEEIPVSLVETGLPQRVLDMFDAGEVRRIGGEDFPPELRRLLGEYAAESGLSGCAIPIRPKEADGALVLIAVSSDSTDQMELSLSRVAAAECALALERASGRARLAHVNAQIRGILALNRETGWGTNFRDTADAVLEHLIDLTSGYRAILLAYPPTMSNSLSPVSSWGIEQDTIKIWRHTERAHPIIEHAVRSGRIHLLSCDRLRAVLGDRAAPAGFSPSEHEALGVLPLKRRGDVVGVSIFLCPGSFAVDAESRNVLAVFAGTAADSLATAGEYERNLAMTKVASLDAQRARTLQIQLTPRYRRSGSIVLWANLHPADDLAGDILLARPRPKGGLAVWAADVAGRGLAAGWSMMFIRQLLGELPTDIPSPSNALGEINSRLFEIEANSPPGGLFATGIGLIVDETSKSVRLARAGAPRIYLVRQDSQVEANEPDGLPLGLFHDAELEETSLPFKPGDKIVWVSDGFQSAQNDANQRWGVERLIELLNSGRFLPGKALYEQILAGFGEFGAVESPHDDRTLVVIGFDLPATWEKSRSGSDRFRLFDESLAFLEKQKFSDTDFSALKLILDEAIRNANEHGNKGEADATIEVRITVHPKYVHLRVRDEGGKLNERVTSVPIRAENLLEDKGRGFLLMRHHSDHLWIEDDRGELNAVRLRGGA